MVGFTEVTFEQNLESEVDHLPGMGAPQKEQ